MQDEKLENSIMGKIKSGQVKLKSKYIFLAEKLGLGTAFALSMLLSVLFFNLILFYLKETDNLKYLSFGKFGIFAFLESFPYLLVIAFIVLIVFSGYLLTKSDVSYKKPFGYLSILMVVLIMIFGGILTYTNLGQSVEKQARMGNESMKMLLNPLSSARDSGVAGVVFEEGEDYLILQTPQGLRKIETREVEDIPEIEKGQFIISVGAGGENFKAKKIRITNREDMPAVDRGIDFKFKGFNEIERECIGQCFKQKNNDSICFKECREKQ
ncbi:MAG: hypothetical protein WC428_07960 [Candidatus Paceibacterota bacterium]|jgi:hypothetical protein